MYVCMYVCMYVHMVSLVTLGAQELEMCIHEPKTVARCISWGGSLIGFVRFGMLLVTGLI